MLPITRKISSYNFTKGNNVKYIVIHETGNVNDSASGNANYFNGGNRGASAHYFVDDKSIYQVVEESNSAWHCGDGGGKYGISNSNSIGIEMCKVSNDVTRTTENNTIELIEYLMKKYNVSIDNVVRHYDASRKICPKALSYNNWARWYDFKNRIGNPIEYTHIALAQCSIVDSNSKHLSTLYAGQRCQLRWITDNYRKYVRLPNGVEGLVEEGMTKYVIELEKAYTHYNSSGTTVDVLDGADYSGTYTGAVWANEKVCVIWANEKGNAFIAYNNSAGEKLCKTGHIPVSCLCSIVEEPPKEETPIEPVKPTVLYRAQVGAFHKKENAEKLVKDLKEKGFDACIKEEQL